MRKAVKYINNPVHSRHGERVIVEKEVPFDKAYVLMSYGERLLVDASWLVDELPEEVARTDERAMDQGIYHFRSED